MIILEEQYFPAITIAIAVISILILWRGWAKGFIFQVLDLLALGTSIFVAWPAGDILSTSFPLFADAEWNLMQSRAVNQIVWFLIALLVIRLLFAILYAIVGWIKKIKVFGFIDHLAGLLVSCCIVFVLLCLLTLVLQMPIIENGSLYVQSTPLKYISTLLAQNLEVLLKGNYNYYAIRSLFSK